jgi:hypothetical protein
MKRWKVMISKKLSNQRQKSFMDLIPGETFPFSFIQNYFSKVAESKFPLAR